MGLALSVIECQHCYDKPKVRKNQERFAKFTVYSKNIIRQTNVQFFSSGASSITVAERYIAAGWGQEVNYPQGQERPLRGVPPYTLCLLYYCTI